jgi:hypothetical protein
VAVGQNAPRQYLYGRAKELKVGMNVPIIGTRLMDRNLSSDSQTLGLAAYAFASSSQAVEDKNRLTDEVLIRLSIN